MAPSPKPNERRAPRFMYYSQVTLEVNMHLRGTPAVVCDISMGGARLIVLFANLCVGDFVKVRFGRHPPVESRVSWIAASPRGSAGVVFLLDKATRNVVKTLVEEAAADQQAHKAS